MKRQPGLQSQIASADDGLPSEWGKGGVWKEVEGTEKMIRAHALEKEDEGGGRV